MSILGEGLEILGLIDKAKNADVYRQLGDYIDKVRTLQIENDGLHSEVKDLKAQLRFKETLERIDGHVFIQGDDEEVCPTCAEVHHRPVHIIQVLTKDRGTRASCPSCRIDLPYRYPKKRTDPPEEAD